MAILLRFIDAALEGYHQFAKFLLLSWVALSSVMIDRQRFLDLFIIKRQEKGPSTILISTIALLLVHIDLFILHRPEIRQPIQISKRDRFVIPTIHNFYLRRLAVDQIVLELDKRGDDCECFAAVDRDVDGAGRSPKL